MIVTLFLLLTLSCKMGMSFVFPQGSFVRLNRAYKSSFVLEPLKRTVTSLNAFRISDKYNDLYPNMILQENETVNEPLSKGIMKDSARATRNCFGGWQTVQNTVKWLLKNDLDHAKERLTMLMNSIGTSTHKLDGENGSIRLLSNGKTFQYWTRNIIRPNAFRHPDLERFLLHLNQVTSGKINVIYYEECQLFNSKKLTHVIIGTGHTNSGTGSDSHIVDLMTAPLHHFLRDEMASFFGNGFPSIPAIMPEPVSAFFSKVGQITKDQTSPSLFLVPMTSKPSPVHELLRSNAALAKSLLQTQSTLVAAGKTPDGIKQNTQFEGMTIALGTRDGCDVMIKDKFGVHCETSYPPLETLLPYLDDNFHELFHNLIEVNQLSQKTFSKAMSNGKANKNMTNKDSSSSSKEPAIDPALLIGRIELAVKSATSKSLTGEAFNEAVIKDINDSYGNSIVDRSRIIGVMKKNNWYQM